jgi:hypothetical protein
LPPTSLGDGLSATALLAGLPDLTLLVNNAGFGAGLLSRGPDH